jgi:dTDP-4-dehydrorhamnose reductase
LHAPLQETLNEHAMRILITGGYGQFARAFVRRAVGHAVAAHDVDELDITSLACVDAIARLEPELIVNAAAITDVDGCEADPDGAYRVNAIGARNVALGAARIGVPLVQISTDYVFDGSKGEPYWEFDRPAPINVYGASKLAGEELACAVWSQVYVVRTAWLYGVGGRNFVTKMLLLAAERPELAVVDTEIGSPTFCDDLADAMLQLAGSGAYGIYHLAGEGSCSRFEFARAVLDRAGRPGYPLRAAERFDRPARPPAYAPLRNFMAAELGIRLPPWPTGLDRFFARGGAEHLDL